MSLKKRALRVQFKLYKGGERTIDLTGHRVEAIIANAGVVMVSATLQMRIYGMNLDDMNALSWMGLQISSIDKPNEIILSAGAEGENLEQVFQGTIYAAYIDFKSAPDVSFIVSARPGLSYQAAPANPTEGNGPVIVQDKIAALAKLMGFGFVNNGVDVTLQNQYLYGDAITQMNQLVTAAGIARTIENGKVWIWPNETARDSKVLNISPSGKNGIQMLGYPEFTPVTMNVKTLFDSSIWFGRKVNISGSVIDKANGEWFIGNMTHELSTMQPNAPWFSNLTLTNQALWVSK